MDEFLNARANPARRLCALGLALYPLYMILYGVERMIVEGLRTDSLYIGKTGIRVSQLLSAILVIVGIALFVDFKVRWKKAVYEGTAEGVDAGESGFAAALEELKGEETAAETAAEAVADAAAEAEETAEDIAADAEETAEKAADAAEDKVNSVFLG